MLFHTLGRAFFMPAEFSFIECTISVPPLDYAVIASSSFPLAIGQRVAVRFLFVRTNPPFINVQK